MDLETMALLRGSVRSALAESDIDVALLELGWDEVVADDPVAAHTLLFEEHGAALATSRSLDQVVLRALGLEAPGRRVLHPLGKSLVALASLDGAVELVLPFESGVRIVPASDARAESMGGIDPDAGWLRVTAPDRGHVAAVGLWVDGVAAARRALASELIGVARAALATASEHVTTREQFGRPIGSFQSVRHRLAEAFVWVSAAETVVRASYVDGSAWAAAAAKAYAGQAHADVSRHCTQVCGAMGLTWEHELPRMVRRGFLLDVLHGSHLELTDQIGMAILEGLTPPRVVEL